MLNSLTGFLIHPCLDCECLAPSTNSCAVCELCSLVLSVTVLIFALARLKVVGGGGWLELDARSAHLPFLMLSYKSCLSSCFFLCKLVVESSVLLEVTLSLSMSLSSP